MVLLNAALNAAMPPAFASLMVWAAWLGGARMARRRFVRAYIWTCAAIGGVVAAPRPWGALAALVNLAIGSVLLGREIGRRARHG
jgi:hypothetical protein